MAPRDPALSIHLDMDAKQRLDKAASIMRLTPESFVARAADSRAHDVLLDWAVTRYREGNTTYALLAEETGLGVVEIMDAIGEGGLDAALDAFLARAGAAADERADPALLRRAHAAAKRVRESPDHS